MLPCSEVMRLCLPLLDMSTFTALSISSKQLRRHVQEIGRNDTTLIRNLFKQEMMVASRTSRYKAPISLVKQHQRTIGRLKEFLGLCCSLHGLTALPSVLNLQSLLVHTCDSYLCQLLISAGARITETFVTTAALGNSSFSLSVWIEAFNAMGVQFSLAPIMEAACSIGPKVLLQEVTQLQPEDLFKLAALQTTTYPKRVHRNSPTPPDMWPPTLSVALTPLSCPYLKPSSGAQPLKSHSCCSWHASGTTWTFAGGYVMVGGLS